MAGILLLGMPTGVTGITSPTSLSNLGAQNQGAVLGPMTITGTQTTAIVIGGTDAALFSVDNGGFVPCNLIAAVDIPAGSYSPTFTAT